MKTLTFIRYKVFFKRGAFQENKYSKVGITEALQISCLSLNHIPTLRLKGKVHSSIRCAECRKELQTAQHRIVVGILAKWLKKKKHYPRKQRPIWFRYEALPTYRRFPNHILVAPHWHRESISPNKKWQSIAISPSKWKLLQGCKILEIWGSIRKTFIQTSSLKLQITQHAKKAGTKSSDKYLWDQEIHSGLYQASGRN